MKGHLREAFLLEDLKDKITRVMLVYADLDEQISQFQNESGINCLKDCGQCCENPAVETTVLEMLPLAFSLWRTDKALLGLESAEKTNRLGRCVFYQPDPRVPGNGRCGCYSFRPLICRLFGFSAVPDKNRRSVWVTCPRIKNEYAQTVKKVQEKIDGVFFIPIMNSYSTKILGVNPSLGTGQFPINEAIAVAIETVGLVLKYNKETTVSKFE